MAAVRFYAADPTRPFLIGEHGAQWLRLDDEVELATHPIQEQVAGYRLRFRVDRVPEAPVLTLRVMKAANVFLDDALVYSTGATTENWKEARHVDLTGQAGVGDHELKVLVVNRDGPPCLLAYSTELNLTTGAGREVSGGWESSGDGTSWTPAVTVNAYRPSGLSRKFARTDTALLRITPLLAVVFALVFVWSYAVNGDGRVSRRVRRWTPDARVFRWLLMGAVGALAANNIFKLPYYYGFDFQGHVDYIRYVAEQWRLPLPTQGWTMFQAPLYYMLSAPLYKAAEAMLAPERALQVLRLIPLACGVAQVEVSYRAARYIFPRRDDLQIAATTVGGLLPVGLYMSQYVGNESLAGLLAGVAVVLALRFYYEPERGRAWRALALLGAVLGLAWLSKLTALFLMPPVAGLMVYGYATHNGPRRLRRMAAGLALVFGTVALVGGWYYARNYLVLGRAFWGGWEPERGIQWWQDPGYRTLRQLIPAGEALVYPVCSSLVSFWDGFYSTLWADGYIASTTDATHAPPWNYNLMLGGVLLALIPSGAILAGAAGALRKRAERPGLLFMAAALGMYVAMLLYGFFSLPYYCITKAAYTMGLACCYGCLAAAGFGLMTRRRILTAAATAVLACWAVTAYFAYFIV